jgi:hypothetical protein
MSRPYTPPYYMISPGFFSYPLCLAKGADAQHDLLHMRLG